MRNILGEEFYTSKEVSEMIGVSASSIAKYLRSGNMNGVKLGGNWYVSKSDLERFLHGKPSKEETEQK